VNPIDHEESRMPAQPPNVLLILADQHRHDVLGLAGNPDVRTPHLDALASDAVHYTHAFCPYPVCTASRYSLLTGQYVHQHGAASNHSSIHPAAPTFPRTLQNAGYRTAAVGKQHFTPTYADVGYQEMFLAEQNGSGRLDDDYHRDLKQAGYVDAIDMIDQLHNHRANAFPGYWANIGAAPDTLPDALNDTNWIANRALAQLDQWTPKQPSLLTVGFIKPHHPPNPPRQYWDLYNPEQLTLLPGWAEQPLPSDLTFSRGYFPHDKLTEAGMRQFMRGYYGCVTHIDHCVGQMIQLLKAKGLYDNTVIIYTSDHGDYLGYHHMALKSGHLYEPLIRVPLLIRHVRDVGRGIKSDTLTSTVDLATTILAEAGLPRPVPMAGRDLALPPAEPQVVMAERSTADGRLYMVRDRRFKLIYRQQPEDCLLFDLETDPHEFTNLYHETEYASIIDRLKAQLSHWILFQTPTISLPCETLPIIAASNAQATFGPHRAAMEAYLDARLAQTPDPFATADEA